MTYYSIRNLEERGIEEVEGGPYPTTKNPQAIVARGHGFMHLGRDCFETRAEAEAAAVKKLDGEIQAARARAERLEEQKSCIIDVATELDMADAWDDFLDDVSCYTDREQL